MCGCFSHGLSQIALDWGFRQNPIFSCSITNIIDFLGPWDDKVQEPGTTPETVKTSVMKPVNI